MSAKKFEDFLRLSNVCFRSIGFEGFGNLGGIDSRLKRWMSLLLSVSIINMQCVMTAEGASSFRCFRAGYLLEGASSFGAVGFIMITNSKMFSVWWRKRELNTVLDELLTLFPQTRVAEQRFGLADRLRRYNWITATYALIYMALVWSYHMSPICKYFIGLWTQPGDYVRELPFLAYYPWHWEENWSYYPIYASLVLCGQTSATFQTASDLLLFAIATQLIMHYDYVANSFQRHQPGVCENDDIAFLRDIADYHERIFRLSALMNRIFGGAMLCNFSVTSLVMCLICFQLTSTSPSADLLITLGLFLISSLVQAYIICNLGQELLYASEGVAAAIYSHPWHNGSARYKRMMLIIAQRAGKTAYLKGTIYLNITRNTLITLLQVSYKFFALLRTMETK